MLQPTQLFDDVPTGLVAVLSTVFLIFKTHWKPLFKLTAIQFIASFTVALVLGMITFSLFSPYILALVATLENYYDGGNYANYAGYGRHLLDYTVGISGASRALEQNDYYNYYYNNAGYYGYAYGYDGDGAINPVKLGLVLISICIVWILVLSLVTSIFSGAFIHAIADIYSGNEPILSKSISHGKERMWSLYCYQILFGIIVTVLGATLLGLSSIVPNEGLLVLCVLISYFFLIAFAIACTAAPPAIVIEGKSALDAFKRSWSLCQKYMCFIFTCQFCFRLLDFFLAVVLNLIVDNIPAFFGFIIHVLYTLASTSASAIIAVVIYMSMRIRSDGVTREDLSLEIGNQHVSVGDGVVDMPISSKEGYNNTVVKAELA